MKSKLFEHLTFISLSYALALIFSGAVMLLPQQALSEESAQGIEEVVVTARRREEISQEVPIPISALSAAYLEDRGITEIQRIEQVTPNLSFTNSSVSRNTAQVFLRGIGQVNWGPTQDPKVGTYIDGVYLGRPQGGVFDLFDIERVEVLRGPQGTLFGRNTTAGLVQVITRNPSDELEAKVRVGTGNAGQVTTDALLNIPLIEGVLAGRVSMQTRRDDGFMKDRSGRKWNETDSKSARAKLLWTPTDTFEAMLTAEYYGARETAGLGKCIGATGSGTGLDFIASIAGRQDDLVRACTPVNDYYLSNDNDPNHADIDTRQITLDMSWDMGWGTLNSLTASRTMDAMSQSWGWGTDFVGEPSNSIDVLEYVRNPYDQVSQEFRIESEAFDDRLTWTVGMYWFYESATQIISAPMWRGIDTNPSAADAPMWGWDYSMLDPSVPPGFMTVGDLFLATQAGASRDQETHATQTSYAAFAEATYEINDEWSVTAGYRYTKDTRKFRRYQFTVGGGFDAENFCPGMPLDANGAATMAYCDQELRYGQATPRLIVNYKFTDDIMVFASFARGYSSGGMNGDIRMRPFEPEISDNWEIGMKSQWMDNQLRLNMNVFQTDYENQQITVSRMQRGQPTADLINAQKATMQGIEMELQATPIEGLRLTASFGYLDGEYDKFSTMDSEWDPVTLEETEFVNDFSHIDFVGGAPYNWSIHAAYEIPMDNGGMVTIGGGWSHRGREYNTLRRFHTSRQDAYGLLDAQIVWDLANNKTSVTIWGTNLNGKEYFRGALDLPSQTLIDGSPTDKYGEPVGQDLGVTIIYPAEPRRYGITLTHNLTN
tara:strand:- start:151 stop:2637 length:2487 start_codon:yes stop_codon:yes gene_type:complete